MERRSPPVLCRESLRHPCNAEGTLRQKPGRARLHHWDGGLTGPPSSRPTKCRWGSCGFLEQSPLRSPPGSHLGARLRKEQPAARAHPLLSTWGCQTGNITGLSGRRQVEPCPQHKQMALPERPGSHRSSFSKSCTSCLQTMEPHFLN